MTKDEERFELWLSEYRDDVLRACYVLLGDRTLAEDAMQDAFIKVWRAMGRYEERDNCSAKTWIMRIAVNTCRDVRRTRWFRRSRSDVSLETLPQGTGPVAEESRELFLDVMRLPEKLKQAVLLYYYEDMTMEEAAQTLNTSKTTLSRWLRRACELLRCDWEGGNDG